MASKDSMANRMSSTQQGSSVSKGKGKKSTSCRRSWTENEEALLIAALKEIVANGWRSDNGFRVGYQKKLEDIIKTQLPNSDIRGTPHIHSKMTVWKKHYNSLCAILSRSGVGFNGSGNYKIDVEDDTWEAITAMDSSVNAMRYKKWPYLEDWKEIFGQDRANGETAEDIADANNDMNDKEKAADEWIGADYEVSPEDLADNEGADDSLSATQKGTQLPCTSPNISLKKRKASDDVANLCQILADFGRKTDERLASLVETIGYESRLGEAAEDAFEELGRIEGLSLAQRFDVCEILSANVDKVKIWKKLPDSTRTQYVERLLKAYGK